MNRMQNIKTFLLDNGLKVVFYPKNDLPIVDVNLWVKIGSKNETIKNSGISHFLEHIVFKNTKLYPNNAISREIENIGGLMNAATSQDYTHFYITLASKYIEKAFSVISDMAFHLELEEKSFSMEKGVIIEEIELYKNLPSSNLFENLYKDFFSISDFVYSRPIIGTKQNILDMALSDISSYYDNNYIPSNMVLFISGDIEFEKIKDLSNKYFNFKKVNDNFKENLSFLDNNFYFGKAPIFYENTMNTINQTYFSISFNSFNYSDIKKFTFAKILSKILGQGQSSKLYKALKLDNNLVWNIASTIFDQKYASLFTIYGQCDYKNLEKIENIIFNEINNFSNTFTNDELEKVKNILSFGEEIEFETVNNITSLLGYYEAMTNFEDSFKIKDIVKNSSMQDILNIKDEIFNKNKFFIKEILKPA